MTSETDATESELASEKTLEAEDQPTKGAEATDADAQGEQPDAKKGDKQPASDKAEAKPPAKPRKSLLDDGKDSEAEKEGEAAEDKPPDKYEFEAPEGVELDDVVVGDFETAARELNLSNDKAQKMLSTVMTSMVKRADQLDLEQREAWQEEIRKDPDVGGEKFDKTIEFAAAARDLAGKAGLDGFVKLLRGPLGDHPDVVRFMRLVGSSISEDAIHVGGQASKELDMKNPAHRAEALYGAE
jgi:hypothetical protein